MNMTNEEKAQEIIGVGCNRQNCSECGGGLSVAEGCVEFRHLKEMAEWKDEQFSIERKQLIEKANQAVTQSFENGAIFKKQEMIDKACKFLKSYRQDTPDGLGYFAGIVNDKTIEDFKNYMKGE